MKKEIKEKKEVKKSEEISIFFVFAFALINIVLNIYILIRHIDLVAALISGLSLLCGTLFILFDTIYDKKSTAFIRYKEQMKNRPLPDNVEKMTGVEFEQYVANRLREAGWNDVQLTKKSNDHGVDVVATKDGELYVFQCKRWKSSIGIDVLQEIHFGKEYYKADHAVVVTSSKYSKNTIDNAERTGIILWDLETLDSL